MTPTSPRWRGPMRSVGAGLLACGVALSALANAETPPAFNPELAKTQAAQAVSEWLDTSQGEALLGTTKASIVQFRVLFAHKATGSAFAGGGFGGGAGSASIHGTYHLKGIDDAAMQNLANNAHDRLVDALKARGVDVVPYASLPEEARQKLQAAAVAPPVTLDRTVARGQSKSYKLVSAHGLPLYFSLGDPLRGEMGMGVALSGLGWNAIDYVESGVAGPSGITLLKATLVMDFMDMETSGGLFSQSASIQSEPGVKLTQESALRAMVPKLLSQKPTPSGTPVWATDNYAFDRPPVVKLKKTLQPADSGLLGVKDTTDATTAAVQNVLSVVGMLGGLGGGRKDKQFEVSVDPQRYVAAAEQSLGAVVESWAQHIAPAR